MSDTPQQPTNGAAGAENAPRFAVLAQYLKDLSFESPRTPGVFQDQSNPKIDVSVDVQGRAFGENQYEVELTVSAKASKSDETVFIVEASYAGAFEITNVPREQLEGVMLVECPRLLFPFMRQIIADATRNGNFPPLMLDPIDFMGVYLANRERAAAQQQPEAKTDAPAAEETA